MARLYIIPDDTSQKNYMVIRPFGSITVIHKRVITRKVQLEKYNFQPRKAKITDCPDRSKNLPHHSPRDSTHPVKSELTFFPQTESALLRDA
jgi:hypothetical protein